MLTSVGSFHGHKDEKVNVKIYTDKSEYKQGEEINITMKN
jgi:uncharacterized protein YfaS (alpha-2-macroglobulin family)